MNFLQFSLPRARRKASPFVGGVGGSRTRVLNTPDFSSFTRLFGYLTPTNSAPRATYFLEKQETLAA